MLTEACVYKSYFGGCISVNPTSNEIFSTHKTEDTTVYFHAKRVFKNRYLIMFGLGRKGAIVFFCSRTVYVQWHTHTLWHGRIDYQHKLYILPGMYSVHFRLDMPCYQHCLALVGMNIFLQSSFLQILVEPT